MASNAPLAAPLLSVRDLHVNFALDEGLVRAVDGVSFDVMPGRVTGIVGESGCGKSVTMRAILQLIDEPGRIESGEILFECRTGAVDGRNSETVDLSKLPRHGARLRAIRGAEIALIPQEPMAAFSPVHTVGDQIIEAILLHQRQWRTDGGKLSYQDAREIVVGLFRDVGISMPEQRVDAYSWQLSGGLRQRAMIAMALSCKPRLLVADEPTTAIDVTTQAQVLALLRDLQRKHGTAIIFITHDLGVIAQMANDVVVMYLGRVVEQGPVDAIFHAPKHPYTRALLRSIPSIVGETHVDLPTIAGNLPHPFNRPPGCPFHPRCNEIVGPVCSASVPQLKSLAGGQSGELFSASRSIGHAMTPPVAGAAARPLLQIRNLRKFFPITAGFFRKTVGHVRAVDDVNFDVYEGETLGLVGESGCGKTTTSRCIMRAITPTSGQILLRRKNEEIVDLAPMTRSELRPLRAEIQMIFQDPFGSLNPRMTLLDNVGEPLLVNGMTNRAERTDRVAELLRLVGLRTEFMHRFPHAFSGGQRQRIGIARALSTNPRLVVADEPVSALDVSVQAQVLNLLLELRSRLGLTFLFVAHDLSVVRHISDRVAVMYVGQLVELAPTRALFSNPRHPYTAALMRAVPVPDPRVARRRGQLEGGSSEPRESAWRMLFPSPMQIRRSPLPARGPRTARGDAGAFRPLSLRREARSAESPAV